VATQGVHAIKKVYFACSISGGRNHAHLYQDIINAIKKANVKVLSEAFADKTLTAEVGHTTELSVREIYDRDLQWLNQADCVIAEITQPSLGVGYEIGKAEELGKPILALFYEGSGRRVSPMVGGNPKVTTVTYRNIHEAEQAITNFLQKL
jgi:nucleoside 2-deoxyribosyltransferase